MKKTFATVYGLALSLLLLQMIMGFDMRNCIAQEKEYSETIPVSGTFMLRYDIFPPIMVFNVSAFRITHNDTILDLNGHTIRFKEEEKEPGFSGVLAESKHNVIIRNGTIANFQYGVEVIDCFDVNVTDILFSNLYNSGVYIRDSREIKVVSCTISESINIGIQMESSINPTENIELENNTVYYAGVEGILLKDCSHVNITGNRVSESENRGIAMFAVDNSSIRGNVVNDNKECGLYMDRSEGNYITNNTLSRNQVGLRIEHSESNVVCHNNFVNNTFQVDNTDSLNSWNYNYPRGGNYWSEYSGEDRFSGENRSVQCSDGIGDEPRIIDSQNRDMHPLKYPYGTMLRASLVTWNVTRLDNTTVVTCYTAFFSDSVISDFRFNKPSKKISFNVKNGTFCEAIIARDLLGGALTCLVDDKDASSILRLDGTHAFVRVDYNTSYHEIQITAEEAIAMLSDLDNNGAVNIVDITLVAKDFGTEVETDKTAYGG